MKMACNQGFSNNKELEHITVGHHGEQWLLTLSIWADNINRLHQGCSTCSPQGCFKHTVLYKRITHFVICETC